MGAPFPAVVIPGGVTGNTINQRIFERHVP